MSEQLYRITLVDNRYGMTRVLMPAATAEEARAKLERDYPQLAPDIVSIDTHTTDSPANSVLPHWPPPSSPAEKEVDDEIEQLLHGVSELDYQVGKLLESIAVLPEPADLIYASLRVGTLSTVERSMLSVLTLVVQATIRLQDRSKPASSG